MAGVAVVEQHGRTCAGLRALMALGDDRHSGATVDKDRHRLRGEAQILKSTLHNDFT